MSFYDWMPVQPIKPKTLKMQVGRHRSCLAWLSYVLSIAQLVCCQIPVVVGAAAGASDTLSLASPTLTPEQPVMAPAPSAKDSQKSTPVKPATDSSSNPSAINQSQNQSQNQRAPVKTTESNQSSKTSTTSPANTNANATDIYPMVGRMEALVFGEAKPHDPIEKRLGNLEQVTFKEQFANQTLFDRTQHLEATILGVVDETAATETIGPSLDILTRNLPKEQNPQSFLDEIANRPENQVEVNEEQIDKFALELVNYLRSEMGEAQFTWDDTAAKMAKAHIDDLAKRNVVSHANSLGENPDLRYTRVGGNDAVTESIVSLSGQFGLKKITRAQIAKLMKTLLEREDDREAILSLDATALGFSAAHKTDGSSLLGCLEIVTRHGAIEPITPPSSTAERVEVKGALEEPYHFEKITIAWEGLNKSLVAGNDESQDALPYFPPLDYIAYASKAEHDYEKAITTLRTLGLIAAIAGGAFMPPVALAAPLIAMSGSTSEPKPMSDIPVHGGVKTDGSHFSARLPFSKEGKDGIYYVTIWASSMRNGKVVPISRRAFSVPSTDKKQSDQAEL